MRSKGTGITRSELIATIAVSVVTTAISIVNKLAVKSFPYSSSLSLIQNVFIFTGIFIYWILKKDGPKFSSRKAKQLFPTAVTTSLNFITNFKALQFLNVSTVAVMHNVNLLLVAVLDYFLFGRRFSKQTLFSLFLIIVGAVLYGYGEIVVSFVGYLWLLFHMFAHEGQSLYTKFITTRYDYSSVEMSFYSSLWSCPILLIAMLYSGEQYQSISMLLSSKAIWAYVSGVLALILSNLRFFSLKTLSVTAYAALNIVNKVPSSIISVFLFDQKVTFVQVVGYIVAFAGAYLYSIFGKRDTFDEDRAIIKKQKNCNRPESPEGKGREENRASEEGRIASDDAQNDNRSPLQPFSLSGAFSSTSSNTLTSSKTDQSLSIGSPLPANNESLQSNGPFDSLISSDEMKVAQSRVLEARKKRSAGRKRGNFSALVEQMSKEALSQTAKSQIISEYPPLPPQKPITLISQMSVSPSSKKSSNTTLLSDQHVTVSSPEPQEENVLVSNKEENET